MCIQCMATAMTSGAAVREMRAWLATRSPRWMTPRRLKVATAALLTAGVIAAGTHVAPNGSATTAKAASPVASAQR